jgi:hypothetical protein
MIVLASEGIPTICQGVKHVGNFIGIGFDFCFIKIVLD